MKIPDVPSELYVEIVRPMARFGLALQIYRRSSDGTIWHARVDDDGSLAFVEIDPGTYPDSPTLYLDEETAHKLYKALAGEPIRLRGEAVNDHLMDVMDQRTKLWSALATQNERYHDLVQLVHSKGESH